MSSNKLFISCKGCEKRHMGCHSECLDYIADKATLDATKDKTQFEAANAIAGYYSDRYAQINRRMHRIVKSSRRHP